MGLQDKKVSFSIKQLLVYGGVPLILIIAGVFFFSNYQIGIYKKGSFGTNTKYDKGSGQIVVAENSPKRIEYQGERYLLDGDYCRNSTGQRIPVTVKRTNGADSGEGADGNTMYAIDQKDAPGYIDSNGTGPSTKTSNCWMKESLYQP